MENKKRHWAEVEADYVEENFCHIDAWQTNHSNEEGRVIAWVDMLTGRVIYADPLARIDEEVQKIVQKLILQAKKNHPFPVDTLENLCRNVVSPECDELLLSNGQLNLKDMGFTDEHLRFFGCPETGN